MGTRINLCKTQSIRIVQFRKQRRVQVRAAARATQILPKLFLAHRLALPHARVVQIRVEHDGRKRERVRRIRVQKAAGRIVRTERAAEMVGNQDGSRESGTRE